MGPFFVNSYVAFLVVFFKELEFSFSTCLFVYISSGLSAMYIIAYLSEQMRCFNGFDYYAYLFLCLWRRKGFRFEAMLDCLSTSRNL